MTEEDNLMDEWMMNCGVGSDVCAIDDRVDESPLLETEWCTVA